MPEVSIIIPVYNVETHVEKCLNSVKDQTFPNFEIIIVDDGSTDSSKTIVERFISDNKNLSARLICHEQNKGLLMARRTGYFNSKGRYVCFLDSDDTLPKTSIQQLYQGITETESDIFTGIFCLINEHGIEKINLNTITGEFNNRNIIELLLEKKIAHSVCGKIYRRELFDNPSELPSYLNQINSEDLMLYYTLVTRANKITISNKIVYNYFFNSNSSSKKKFSDSQFIQLITATNYLADLLANDAKLNPTLSKYICMRMLSIMAQGCPDKYIKGRINENVKSHCDAVMQIRLTPANKILFKILWSIPLIRKVTSSLYR